MIESFLKGALPQIIPLMPIARAELEHPVRIDMEPLHAAPAGRRFRLISVAGFFPEIVVLTVEDG